LHKAAWLRYMSTYIHTYIYVHTHTHTYVHTYIHIYILYVYIHTYIRTYIYIYIKNITSSVYDCTVEDVEYIHVVIALTGAHMQPACVTELTSSEY